MVAGYNCSCATGYTGMDCESGIPFSPQELHTDSKYLKHSPFLKEYLISAIVSLSDSNLSQSCTMLSESCMEVD